MQSLLEYWRPPQGAGDPIGCLATTFTFDARFFEEECLGRFLGIESLPDQAGLAFEVERENKLGEVFAGVLVDRLHASGDHSLRWQLMPVRLPGSIQHSKISLICWHEHVRIIIASANLTSEGYRSNFEVAGVIDISKRDESPKSGFVEVLGFLRDLMHFVPEPQGKANLVTRANAFLEVVERFVDQFNGRKMLPPDQGIKHHVVFSFPKIAEETVAGAKGTLQTVFDKLKNYGSRPSSAQVVSPFFDVSSFEAMKDRAAVALGRKLNREARREITFYLRPEVSASGDLVRVLAPRSLFDGADAEVDSVKVKTLPLKDGETCRAWHAKMLFLESVDYYALLIGSANFTTRGMGLIPRCNAEAGLLYVAPREKHAREPGLLREVWPSPTQDVKNPEVIEWLHTPKCDEEGVSDEQKPLPDAFVAALFCAIQPAVITLHLLPDHLPKLWRIKTTDPGSKELLNSDQYRESKEPSEIKISWTHDNAPGQLLVTWGEGCSAFWPINVEDPNELPPPFSSEDMTVEDLLSILAATHPGAALGKWAKKKRPVDPPPGGPEIEAATDLNPLNRYDLHETFLHQVRRKARQWAQVRINIEKPVWSEKALQWRLNGVLGVFCLAERMTEGWKADCSDLLGKILEAVDMVLALQEVKYQSAEGCLDIETFNKIYNPFLMRVINRVNERIEVLRTTLPADIIEFWDQVSSRRQL
jgi:hypothetical protein